MKNFIKKIDWLTASLIFLVIVMTLFMIGGFMKTADNISRGVSETNSKEYKDMYRKSRICLTYSDKFWQKDRFKCNFFMRPEKDWRPAYQVKEDMINKHIGFENILFAFDDDDKINEMYKKHGVTCYKPNITNIV